MVHGVQTIPPKQWFYSQRNSSFLGVRMLQRWVDLVVWEKLLNVHMELRAIVELGTGRGSFSTFLLLQAMQRGLKFWTYDNRKLEEMETTPVAQRLDLARYFRLGDIFDSRSSLVEVISHRPALHPLILFCDNGDKPREFRTFVPHLWKGDLVGVHDWTEEFCPVDVKPVRDWIEPVFFGECEEMGSITRFWRVIK